MPESQHLEDYGSVVFYGVPDQKHCWGQVGLWRTIGGFLLSPPQGHGLPQVADQQVCKSVKIMKSKDGGRTSVGFHLVSIVMMLGWSTCMANGGGPV